MGVFFVSTFLTVRGIVIEMKKLFLLIGLIFLLNSCAPTPTTYSNFTNKNLGYYKYTASARSYSQRTIANFMAVDLSQAEANRRAKQGCNLRAINNDCYIEKEGLVNVWEKNAAHLIAIDEEEKKKKELAEQKKKLAEQKMKEEVLLASINLKRGTCTKMGFESETEGMANCVLQLMLQENQGNTNTTIDNSGMVSAMNTQNAIMERQLRLQRLEHTQKQMKTFQYMMDHGKMPPLGYGY